MQSAEQRYFEEGLYPVAVGAAMAQAVDVANHEKGSKIQPTHLAYNRPEGMGDVHFAGKTLAELLALDTDSARAWLKERQSELEEAVRRAQDLPDSLDERRRVYIGNMVRAFALILRHIGGEAASFEEMNRAVLGYVPKLMPSTRLERIDILQQLGESVDADSSAQEVYRLRKKYVDNDAFPPEDKIPSWGNEIIQDQLEWLWEQLPDVPGGILQKWMVMNVNFVIDPGSSLFGRAKYIGGDDYLGEITLDPEILAKLRATGMCGATRLEHTLRHEATHHFQSVIAHVLTQMGRLGPESRLGVQGISRLIALEGMAEIGFELRREGDMDLRQRLEVAAQKEVYPLHQVVTAMIYRDGKTKAEAAKWIHDEVGQDVKTASMNVDRIARGPLLGVMTFGIAYSGGRLAVQGSIEEFGLPATLAWTSNIYGITDGVQMATGLGLS